jgi:hypothetical protein
VKSNKSKTWIEISLELKQELDFLESRGMFAIGARSVHRLSTWFEEELMSPPVFRGIINVSCRKRGVYEKNFVLFHSVRHFGSSRMQLGGGY